MLKRIDLRGAAPPWTGLLPRPQGPDSGPVEAVRDILAEVERDGDVALRRLTERFDGVVPRSLVVGPEAMAEAAERTAAPLRDAMETAAGNVRAHHERQMPGPVDHSDAGVRTRSLHVPVTRAGCYVPGGRATYPSTVIMTAVPARVAGVDEVVVAVPPDQRGLVPDVVLAAAHVAGVTAVHPVGGAQAIAALAYGTESIAPVDVIVGPGNVYVALAKAQVSGRVGVPSAFAGPSEVVVVADGTVDPELVAIDLVLQAEHGPDGLAWLVTWDDAVADEVTEAVTRTVARAPRAPEITSTLARSGHAVVCSGPDDAMAVVNHIAPEHLELMVDDPEALVPAVRNAGAVFCGQWAPASLGDYVVGPSHVLPTNGTARFAGALNVTDFLKDVHVVTVDRDGLERLAPAVIALAEAEGLDAHAESVRLRRLERRPPVGTRS